MVNRKEAVSVDPDHSASVTGAAGLGVCVHSGMPFMSAQTLGYVKIQDLLFSSPQLRENIC